LLFQAMVYFDHFVRNSKVNVKTKAKSEIFVTLELLHLSVMHVHIIPVARVFAYFSGSSPHTKNIHTAQAAKSAAKSNPNVLC